MIKNYQILIVIGLLISQSILAAKKPTVIPHVNAKAPHQRAKKSAESMQTSSLSQQTLANALPVNLSNVLLQEQSIVRITNSSGDNNQTALSIRGFGDNAAANSLILIDGFPFTNTTSLAPNINALALEDITNIEIFQGSQGSLWGNQAVGGVVNIATKHPTTFMANANAASGSFNTKYVSALLGNKFNNDMTIKGFYLADQSDQYRQHQFQQLHSELGQLSYTYSSGSTQLTLRNYTNTSYLPGGLTQAQYDTNPRQATNFSNVARYHTTIAQLLNKQILNDKWLLETRFSNQAMDGDGKVSIPFTRNEWQLYFNPRVIGHLNQHKIITGYVGEQSHFHVDNTFVHDSANETEHQVYLQLTSPIYDKWNIILGGREALQQNNTSMDNQTSLTSSNHLFVSEQGITFQPTSNWQFYLRRDGNFRFPKANEQTWLPKGIPSLKPQHGVSYETGANWITEKAHFQLSLYQLRLQNEIAFNPAETETEPFGAYQNYEQTVRNGVTITETYQVIPDLIVKMQFNYVNAYFLKGVYSGKKIPAVPSVNGNLGISYELTNHWRINYAGIYTGNQYASEDNFNQGNRVPNYWLHNIGLQYQRRKITTTIEIDNLFNKLYAGYTLFDALTKQNIYYPNAGRSLMFTIKANLD